MSTPAATLTVRVARKQALAQDICALELQPVSGALPPFEAGAHIDVHLPASDGERVRQYSLCSTPVDTSADAAFEVEIASTGRVIPVRADQSTLQALVDAGLDVPSSCEQGVCGTCLTGVKSGTPLHRDHYLTPEEQAAHDQFLPCCSRARSARLVLDL